MKDSAAYCNAVLFILCNSLGLTLGVMGVKQLLYLGVPEQLLCTFSPYGFVGLSGVWLSECFCCSGN
jgi:hypothetical protein